MGATFPNGIVEFTEKKNLFDDVDANDINRMQNEIRAIEEVLGPLVNTVTNIVADVNTLDQEVDFINAEETQEQLIFENMAAQLEYLRLGQNHDAVSLTLGKQITLNNFTKSVETVAPPILKMGKPNYWEDPNKLYNSRGGITLKKNGLYVVHGHVRYNTASTGINSTKNYGMFEAGIDVGGAWYRGFDRTQSVRDNIWANVMLDPIAIGYFRAGQSIYLRTAQTTEIPQLVGGAYLEAVLIRNGGQAIR